MTEALRGVRAEPIARSTAGPGTRVVLALSRIEVRHLLRHPTFLAPMGLVAVLGSVAAARVPLSGVIYVVIGVIVATLLSANIQALRARRDSMQELLSSLPAPASARTAAQLSAIVMGPVAIAALVPLIAFAAQPLAPAPPADEAFTIGVLGYLVGYLPLVVFVMGSLGFVLGRWIPSPVAGPLAVVAHVTTPLLAIMIPWLWAPPDTDMSARTVGWNVAYLLGLATLWSSLAFARDRRRPGPFVLAGAGLGLAVAGAILQGRPPGGYL